MLDWSRYIGRIDLNNIVIALFLLHQKLDCLVCITRCNYAIGYLTLDESCCILITHIGKCNEITEGRHTVSASCSRIGTCQWRKLAEIIYPVDLRQCIVKRKSHSRTCRRYMLEGSCCRKSGCFFQLLYKLPAIKCIQKVDITRLAIDHLDWKLASILHVDTRWFLIRVTSILKHNFVCHDFSSSAFLDSVVFIDNL